MSNPLFSSMANNGLMTAVQSLRSNPMQYLMQRKFNVPQNLANDPNAIIQHLMQTGQVSQDAYNRAINMAQRFK